MATKFQQLRSVSDKDLRQRIIAMLDDALTEVELAEEREQFIAAKERMNCISLAATALSKLPATEGNQNKPTPFRVSFS